MGRKLRRRERLFLAVGGAAVLLLLLGRWFVLPLYRYSSGAGSSIEESLAVLEAYQVAVARESALEEETGLLDEQLRSYRGFYLSGETPPLAAAVLESRLKEMAAEAGLNVVSGKILKHEEKEAFVEIPVQIVATGSIEGFRDFIVLVENAELFIGIRELNLRALGRRQAQRTRAKAGANSGQIQATITVNGLMPA